MKRNLKFAFVFLVVMGLVGCASGTSSTEDELSGNPDEIPELDAGTDAVPEPDAEQPVADAPPSAEDEQPADAMANADQPPPADQPVPPADVPPADQALNDMAAPPVDQPPVDAAPAPEFAPPADAPAPVEATAEAAPAPVAMSGDFQTYSVSAGDTLMKIAFETYGDLYQWKRIYEDNKDQISNPNALPAGLQLKLSRPAESVSINRNGEKYMIKQGDTLGRISSDIYGTAKKWRKLWENNKQLIKDPNKIFAGFFLYYTMTPEERDEADRLKQSRPMAPPLASGEPVPSERNPASMAPPVTEPAPMNGVSMVPSPPAAPVPPPQMQPSAPGVPQASAPANMPPVTGGAPGTPPPAGG